MSATDVLDLVGVGVGPSNLSLAALAAPVKELRTSFHERRAGFAWHPGLLLPESTIQVSFLKDLVTPVDPRSPYSFLSFLVAHRRFYHFLSAKFRYVSRAEFAQYMTWVARSLDTVHFDSPIESIEWVDDRFKVSRRDGVMYARNIALGTGQAPWVPECTRQFLGETVLHSNQFLHVRPPYAGRSVAVVGGGQSGAELVNHLLQDTANLPSRLFWISRRPSFLPLDDSPFTNDLFSPAYSEHFFQLDAARRQRHLDEQVLASDGIRAELLEQIYRRLYVLEHVEQVSGFCRLWPSQDLVGMRRSERGWILELSADRERGAAEADLVLLATGFRPQVPRCLEPLLPRIGRLDDQLDVRTDFSIAWDGPADRRIYVQNAARHRYGVADPNLSLLAWRTGKIVNSLTGRKIYDCAPQGSLIEWPA